MNKRDVIKSLIFFFVVATAISTGISARVKTKTMWEKIFTWNGNFKLRDDLVLNSQLDLPKIVKTTNVLNPDLKEGKLLSILRKKTSEYDLREITGHFMLLPSPSIAWQVLRKGDFINKDGTLKQDEGYVKKWWEHGKNCEFYYKKLDDYPRVVVMQIPCLNQTKWKDKGWHYNVCGYHTWVNSKIMAELTDVSRHMNHLLAEKTKKNIDEFVKKTNSKKRLILPILKEVKKPDQLWTTDFVKFIGGDNLNPAAPTTKGDGRYIFDLTQKGLAEHYLETGQLTPEKIISEKKPLTLMTFVSGSHWVTIRVEPMPNGMWAILVVDSLSPLVQENHKIRPTIVGFAEKLCLYLGFNKLG